MDRKLQSEIDAVVVRRGTVLSALSCKLTRVPQRLQSMMD